MLKNYEERAYTNPNATLSKNTKGREKPIDDDPKRTAFQRDVHRIAYSQPFRRLRHKTQVFFVAQNDHVCTRLEHVLYVASASRTVARNLGLNEDLAEAIGFGHDLGHAPFGHHGEKILGNISKKWGIGEKFHHEVHGLRVVDKLAFLDRERAPGLNLTYEVRDGIVSHCGEKFEREFLPLPKEKDLGKIRSRDEAGIPTTLEGCIVRMVDKIAYAGRDLEDGLKTRLITEAEIPKDVTSVLGKNNGEIVGNLLGDLIEQSSKAGDRICLSEEKHAVLAQLVAFNYEKIYLTPRVSRYKAQATAALEAIADLLLEDIDKTARLTIETEKLPQTDVYDTLREFISWVGYKEGEDNRLVILDFVSGMTDNYVLYCVDQIFVPKPFV